MKTMTCRQLGGVCDLEFQADKFEEVAEMSKKHGMEMHQKGDEEYIKAMEGMGALMGDPNAMKEWFDRKRSEFDSMPTDK